MSTLNVSDITASKLVTTAGGVKLSSHSGPNNYPTGESGLMIYDSAAADIKFHNGSAWGSPGGSTIASGDRSGRPSSPDESNVRYNTQDGQIEYYFKNQHSNQGSQVWAPVGGRNLVCWTERKDNWGSIDMKWGPGNGAATGGYYNSYEIIMNFYEPGGGNGEYYIRWIDANGNVDSNGGRYFYMVSGWHANDGRPRAASGTGGRSYFAITAQNGSYELQSNGESSYTAHIYMSNTPNSSTANYWSYYMFGAGATEQNGGEYHGGGVWRGAARKGNTGYPLGGMRIYSNVNARSVTNGCNFACAVYGTMPSIRDYPEAGSYINY